MTAIGVIVALIVAAVGVAAGYFIGTVSYTHLTLPTTSRV